jgi:UDP-hydrolysing UDP-N-acetyl-D-glucosamine 2-epimerase
MKSMGVVTTSRADWGIYRPLVQAIQADPDSELLLIVAGMHLAPEFGLTARQIEAEGWRIDRRVECLLSSDTGLGMAKSLGLAVMGFAEALEGLRPDLLVVLGDRFEMFAAVCAAAPLRLPVAHLHGGELTLGALDDGFRHAMTKLSHLHLVATRAYADRVVRMGEEPWRVTVCGALSLDNLENMRLLPRGELARELDLDLEPPPVLVTYHPETLSDLGPGEQLRELLAALEQLARPVVFTLPNADSGGRELGALIRDFCTAHAWAQVRDNLGTQRYFSLMAASAAMLGNSSSGIIEAPSLGLPVVNVGDRQAGRVRGAGVLDAPCRRSAIGQALAEALDPAFAQGLRGNPNPYRHGGSAAIILDVLKNAPDRAILLRKGFHDGPFNGPGQGQEP